MQQDSSFSVIESSFYVIHFYQLLLNLESLCNSPVAKNMLEVAKELSTIKRVKRKL